jgi:hypothetical protein
MTVELKCKYGGGLPEISGITGRATNFLLLWSHQYGYDYTLDEAN